MDEAGRLEMDFVAELLTYPMRARMVTYKLEWFTVFAFEQVAEAIQFISETEEADIFNVEEYIRGKNPYSPALKDNLLVNLLGNVEKVGIDWKASLLEKRYLERVLKKAAADYAKEPTEANRVRLNAATAELENAGAADEDGNLEKAFDSIEYHLEHEREDGVLTYPKLDFMIGNGMQGGRLIVIGARPAVGKTMVAMNLQLRAYQENKNVRADMFVLEMTEEQYTNRMLTNLTGFDGYRVNMAAKLLKDKERDLMRQRIKYLKSLDMKVFTKKQTVDSIIRSIRQRAEGYEGKYVCFVDYLQLVGVRDVRKNRDLQVGEITRRLKLLANELGITVVLLSQLNRGLESRNEKKPTMADLRESGNIEQDADIILLLHEEPVEDNEGAEQGILNMLIEKNRDGKAKITIPFHVFKSIMLIEEREG